MRIAMPGILYFKIIVTSGCHIGYGERSLE